MRTLDEQAIGLGLVQRLVPGSEIVQHQGEPEMLALRSGDREIVYVIGEYDGWIGESYITPDMILTEAAAFLKGGVEA